MNKETDRAMTTTIRGLKATAIEKILVLGPEEAKEDLEQIRSMIEELIRFWGLFDGYLAEYDRAIEEVIKA